jgi:hypothetical protein
MRGAFSQLRWRKRVDSYHTRLKLYPNTEIKTSSQSILFEEKGFNIRHTTIPLGKVFPRSFTYCFVEAMPQNGIVFVKVKKVVTPKAHRLDGR